jgi:hypothetical protein
MINSDQLVSMRLRWSRLLVRIPRGLKIFLHDLFPSIHRVFCVLGRVEADAFLASAPQGDVSMDGPYWVRQWVVPGQLQRGTA